MEMPKTSLNNLLATIPSQTLLDQNVSDLYLADIAKKLTNWKSVCSYLGLSEAEEKAIEEDHKKTNVRWLAMLRKWRSKYGPTATYRELANCFYRADMQSMVQEICQLLGDRESLLLFKKTTVDPGADGGGGGGWGSGTVSTRLLIIAAILVLVAIITGIGLPQMKMDDGHSWTQVADKYAEKLKLRYRQRFIWIKDHRWPPQLPQKFYNLTLLKVETVRSGTPSISESFTRLTMTGKVKEALRKKNTTKLHQVFMKSVDRQKMTVLFEGYAGSGKSVLSLHLCLQWIDEKLFQDYKLVILVQLREPAIANATQIKEILPRVGMEEDAAQWIENNAGSGVLFIMDGWDELPKPTPADHIIKRIIHREVLPESTIVITSRPTSSVVLHNFLTSRIEILGFSPEDLRDYFTNHLDNNSSKAHTLLQKIRANPFVAGTCTLPLNAAILVFIFRQEGDLPTTEHRIFDALIRNCILRHLKERTNLKNLSAIKSLANLPPLVQSQYNELREIAYKGVMGDLVIFQLLEDFETLGLLQGVELYTSSGSEYFYNFFHLSVQEFLAAHHIATAFKPAEQVAELEKLFGKARFLSTFKHYSAITKLATRGIDKIVLQIVKRSAADNPSYADRVHLLSLLNCLYEAQNPSMYKLVADNLGPELDLSYITLKHADCLSIGYFFKYVKGIKVDFSKCFIDAEGCKLLFSQAQVYQLRFLDFAENAIGDEGCTALCRGLQKYRKLQVLGIWRNNLTDASIKPLTELITTAKSLRRLILGGNHFSENGRAQLRQAVQDRDPEFVKLSLSISFY